MKVLVTGGSGWIGGYVVCDLIGHGHDVLSVDLSPPVARQNQPHTSMTRYDATSRHLTVDITHAGQVYQALTKAQADAVIHLAAWPNANIVPDTRTYGDNVQGTFNIFQACADLGILRIVSASSAQVYGLADTLPRYVPLDEDHPLHPVNCYALSKVAGEQAAAYFSRRHDLTICSFRFMGVRPPALLNDNVDRIMQHPEGDTALMWTRTDARDAATACRLAVERYRVPAGPYNISGTRIVLEEPTADLIERYLGPETELKTNIPDDRSPMSCARAEEAFGYRPQYHWSASRRYPES